MHVKHALLLLVLVSGSLFGQTMYKTSDQLQYDYNSKKTLLRSTTKPFTGVEYTISGYYYNTGRDTTLLRGFTNGVLDWQKQFYAKGVLQQYQVYYNHGLKNDSICMERITYDATSHDTIGYEVHVINKKGQKFYRYRSYFQSYQVQAKSKPVLQYAYTMQFFSYNDAKNFDDQQYRKRDNYDSSGFHSTYAQTGWYVVYHTNGKIQARGRYNTYEYRLAHKGQQPSYPNYGKIGTWSYYTQEGIIQREEIYKEGNPNIESTQYYADGKIQARYNYTKLGRDLKLPHTDGLGIKPNDSCMVTQTYWNQEGKMTNEVLRTPAGYMVNCTYHGNGKISSQTSTFNNYKPVGIWKYWDEKGKVYRFTNYSVESNDTICYKALHGKITALNLRNRGTAIQWDLMPGDYYGTQARTYLYNKAGSYVEFYGNGKIKSSVELKAGKRDGVYSEWDSLGAEILHATFKNDIPNGQWNEWYSNGRPKKMLTYKDGIRDGAYTEYYANGQLKWENVYANGVPGKGKAYSENGTPVKSSNYLQAFYPAQCLNEQLKSVSGTVLHYYLADTALSRSYVTLSDTMMRGYGLKIVAALGAITRNYDYCSPANLKANDNNEFDLYHSCVMVSKSLYTEANKVIIKNFFARHNITIDREKESDNPVLGFEKEFLIYYSAKEILNKQVIVDSLELYLAPNANDPKKGYLMSIDLNYPKGQIIAGGSRETITTSPGYSTISVEKNTYIPTTYQSVKETAFYIVYDDLTSDYKYSTYSIQTMEYWAMK